jgi:WD40 repeat protein
VGTGRRTVQLFEVATGKQKTTVELDSDSMLSSWTASHSGIRWSGSYLALSPDGGILAISDGHFQVRLWNLQDKSKPRRLIRQRTFAT